jgi:hypothetical protein
VIFILSGCSDSKQVKDLNDKLSDANAKLIKNGIDSAKLYNKISELETKLKLVSGNQLFELEKQQNEAAIAQACSQPFNINICPNSITKAGNLAIQSGISGGNSSIFWITYSLKIFFIIFIATFPIFIGSAIWTRRFKPIFDAYKVKKKAIEEFDERLKIIAESFELSRIELEQIKWEIGQQMHQFNANQSAMQEELDERSVEIEEKKRICETLDANIHSKQAALHAMQAFKL